MRFKKFLSILFTIISIGSGVVIHTSCKAMKESDYCYYDKSINKYIMPYTSRCNVCGWIGTPKVKRLPYSKKMVCSCKNCGRLELLGKKLFISWNNSINKYTKKFGICPNSTREHPHFGNIIDNRIKSMNRKKFMESVGIGTYKFHCYKCKKTFDITSPGV